jgi:hypothetical protein
MELVVPKPRASRRSVFLNIPYDKQFEKLYLAYIVGVSELGLTPKVTLGIPSGDSRLDRIFKLIQSSDFSVHDLSRVQLDRKPPATPRFNMPFELGLAIAWSKLHRRKHTCFVFEGINRRGHKSLSDLSGYDFYIHGATPRGVMRELCNAFVRSKNRPTVPQMMRTYRQLLAVKSKILESAGTADLFEARVFEDLVASVALIREVVDSLDHNSHTPRFPRNVGV